MKASQIGLAGQPSSITSSVVIQISVQSTKPAPEIPSQPTEAPQPQLDLVRRQATGILDTTQKLDEAAATSSHEELAIAPDPTPSQSGGFKSVFGDPGAAPTPSRAVSQFPSVATGITDSTATTVVQPGQGSSIPIGAIIGVTVAAGVVLFAFLIAGCAIWRRKLRRKQDRREMMAKMDRMYDFVPGQAAPMTVPAPSRPKQGPMIEMGRKPLTKSEMSRYPYPSGLKGGTHTPTLSQASLATRELPPLPVYERGTGDSWGPRF